MSAARTISSLSFLVAIAAASIGVLPARAHVITCDHLKTALVASAFEHHLQTPVARSEQVSPSNPDDVAWMISFEGLSQPVAMICHSDYVASFAADTRELNSSTVLVMDIALTASGFEPEVAAKIRDVLITEAKQSRIAEITAGRTKISLIISSAGAPSFQMDASW